MLIGVDTIISQSIVAKIHFSYKWPKKTIYKGVGIIFVSLLEKFKNNKKLSQKAQPILLLIRK